jgi:ABC-2 type transport system permease protein
MSRPGSLAWFAAHELRLSWRDFRAMLNAGRPRRTRTLVIAFLIIAAFLHFIAYRLVGGLAEAQEDPDKATLIVVTVSALLAWSIMLSQAIESVTRAFYARADLDLILSSPADARKVFIVRIVALGASAIASALVIASPFINVLIFAGGPRWIAGYVAALAMGAIAAALAVIMTAVMFQLIGPKRTRLVAQIVAAVIGAAFVIGLQIGAIFSFGTISHVTLMRSVEFLTAMPEPDSLVWWPARAILGEPVPLLAMLALSMTVFGAATALFAGRFESDARSASAVQTTARRTKSRLEGFRRTSRLRTLRLKEWTLLRRDPWLASQTMMQLLYLLPPALLLWRSFGERQGTLLLLVPVLVMAAGQLAGGLAWLAVSGEDAPDLIGTAPIAHSEAIRAKIEAVIGAVAILFAPLVIVFALASAWDAAVTVVGIILAAGAATAIQLWFRVQAKRRHFRRRQTSSRLATFSEALSSIGWAATAGLAASGTWLALGAGVMTVGVLSGAYYLRPRPA